MKNSEKRFSKKCSNSYKRCEKVMKLYRISEKLYRNSEKLYEKFWEKFSPRLYSNTIEDDLIIIKTSRLYYFVMNKQQPYDWFTLEALLSCINIIKIKINYLITNI